MARTGTIEDEARPPGHRGGAGRGRVQGGRCSAASLLARQPCRGCAGDSRVGSAEVHADRRCLARCHLLWDLLGVRGLGAVVVYVDGGVCLRTASGSSELGYRVVFESVFEVVGRCTTAPGYIRSLAPGREAA